jgi:hypothetical protein
MWAEDPSALAGSYHAVDADTQFFDLGPQGGAGDTEDFRGLGLTAARVLKYPRDNSPIDVPDHIVVERLRSSGETVFDPAVESVSGRCADWGSRSRGLSANGVR